MENITIKDKTIITFYNENPHLDIVSINHIFIDILKKLSVNLSNTIDNSITTQILSVVSDIKGELYKINSDIITKLHDSKKEYIEDVKLLLANSEFSNQEKINHLFDKSNDNLLSKTTLLLGDISSKNNDKNYAQIESCMKSFFHKISEDTKELLKRNEKGDSAVIIENIENSFNKMVANIQQPIFNVLQASESRTQQTIQQVNENLSLQKQVQETLSTELNVFLNKYKSNSSVKGSVSESELYSILQTLVPSDEIIRCSSDTATCDIKLNRRDKKLPTILFENKDYTASVDKGEIEKFERDLQRQKCHGVFISQKSPITYKSNFHIDIINHIIHLYIPNCNYDPEKIRLAINIIDNLADKITFTTNSGELEYVKMTNEELEEIKEEYRVFANKKNEIIDMIKLITKQLIEKLDDIQLPLIKKITVGNTETKNIGILCNICNKFTGKNKGSLSAHMKACAKTASQANIVVNTSL
jgi:hypothetical protein